MKIIIKNVEIFKNERALYYDSFITQWIPGYHFLMLTIPNILKSMAIKNNLADMLVVGCGTGNEIIALRNSGFSGPITGIDPSPQMIEQAIKKLKGVPNVLLINGIVKGLPTQRLYSAATLILVLHFLDDNGAKLALLRDISSRLEPGAPFILVDVFGDKQNIKSNLLILKKLLPSQLNQTEIEERLQRIENTIHYISESRVCELLDEAGFEKPLRFYQSSVYGGWFMKKKK